MDVTHPQAGAKAGQGDTKEVFGLRMLLVDDSAAQRALLTRILKRSGYEPVVAVESADQALALLDDPMPTVVLCDWMMPGMSGPEFCERVRALDHRHYVYILILTSMKEKAAPALALDVGADDFLTKPVNADELRARLRAGIRVVEMQARLLSQKEAVSQAFQELETIHSSIEKDLTQARALQRALLPEPECDFGLLRMGFLLQSAGKVGGDMVGWFPAGTNRVGAYSLDVSGHGVASALLCARVAGMISNLAATAASAEEIVSDINRNLLNDIETDLYLTIALALVDMRTGETELVQAGHPHPLIRRADGRVELVGAGGLPVGLVAGAEYDSVMFRLRPGDRLLLQSDGFVECPLPDGDMLGEEDLAEMFGDPELDQITGPLAVLEHLLGELVDQAGRSDFPDDVSAMLIEIR